MFSRTLSLRFPSVLEEVGRVTQQYPRFPLHFNKDFLMPLQRLPHPRRRVVPSVLMRSGTSKGLFLKREDLPADINEWSPIILGAMGSLDGDKRQLNGVGGGSSTTSKVVVVSKSQREGVDVDYTFIQVPVGGGMLDFSGNCGNMASGIGPFALDEGLVEAPKGTNKVDIRIHNTNTDTQLVETVEVDEFGFFQPEGDYHIGGFAGSGSRIDVAFMDPAGSMTGKLFPTGQREERLEVLLAGKVVSIRATLIDAANPFIFVDRSTLPISIRSQSPESTEFIDAIEAIRRVGAVAYGLATSVEAASRVRGTPKIALLSPPPRESKLDIQVMAFSMGKMHPSLQLTGAVCLGAALSVPGTVASRLSTMKETVDEQPPSPPSSDTASDRDEGAVLGEESSFLIGHSSGSIDVAVKTRHVNEDEVVIEYAKVARTARRLFEGSVIVNLPTPICTTT